MYVWQTETDRPLPTGRYYYLTTYLPTYVTPSLSLSPERVGEGVENAHYDVVKENTTSIRHRFYFYIHIYTVYRRRQTTFETDFYILHSSLP